VRSRLRFLVATIPSDSHTWNLMFLQLLLEEMGYEVVNLGACVPIDVLVESCRLHRPDAVVISSVNGLAQVEAPEVVAAIRACPDLAGLRVVVGGKLGILGADNHQYIGKLIESGFDAVFSADEPKDRFVGFCERLGVESGVVQ
jgi:methylmalonyl-CoA mutase cobalamin-binding subunit